MTTMKEQEAFLAIQLHILKCDEPIAECAVCRSVFGERRPPALLRARFREGRPQVAVQEGAPRG